MSVEHELKCHPGPFTATVNGSKPFEYRRNDRGYEVGDTVLLREWVPDNISLAVNLNPPSVENVRTPGYYTGRTCRRTITYMLNAISYGVPTGWCVLGLSRE